nr:RecName: Full=64 kDa cell wall protein [Arabidopsis thaliana]
MREIEHIPPP